MKIAITMTAWKRPDYLRRALASLAVCAGDTPGLISVDESESGLLNETVCVARSCSRFALWMHRRYGCNQNTRDTIDFGFETYDADFVVHVEEDVLLAPDALDFFTWAAERFRDDPAVFSATGYTRPPSNPDQAVDPSRVLRRSWFHPWGFGLWRDRWEAVRGRIPVDGPATWDHYVNDYLVSGGMVEVAPELARSQNIGRISSIGSLAPEWYDANHTLTSWAGDGRELPPPGSWHI
jgi:hypothetical protein